MRNLTWYSVNLTQTKWLAMCVCIKSIESKLEVGVCQREINVVCNYELNWIHRLIDGNKLAGYEIL